jgi:chromatin segregation and condensation protein Rec8/ScpA/Scc1 (kleisin family)
MLLDLYTKRYIDEFDVTSDLMSEVTTMTMLAATHVLEMRAFMLLGRENEEDEGEPTGLIRNVVGYDDDEKPIVQLQEHPAYNQLERAWRWRKNLLESLVGTRKEKYKRDAAMQDRQGDSVSQSAANLKSTIDKLTTIDITPNK